MCFEKAKSRGDGFQFSIPRSLDGFVDCGLSGLRLWCFWANFFRRRQILIIKGLLRTYYTQKSEQKKSTTKRRSWKMCNFVLFLESSFRLDVCVLM